MTPPTQPVGEFLFQARRRKGLSQGALARKLDRDQNAISRYERGRTPVPLDLVPKLAEILDLNSEELVLKVAYEAVDQATINVKRLDRMERLLDRMEEITRRNEDFATAMTALLETLADLNERGASPRRASGTVKSIHQAKRR